MSFASLRTTHRLMTTAAAVTLLLSAACANDASTAPSSPSSAPPSLTQLPRSLSVAEQQLVTGSNDFAFKLFHAVDSAAGPDSNVFISPLSASMALGMTTVGAASSTLDAMRTALGYHDLPVDQMAASYQSLITLLHSLDTAVDFRIANAIWYNHELTVRPAFASTVQSGFDASISPVDFANPATVPAINAWVNSSTAGKIPTLIDGTLPSDMVMFLSDAIYFHGSWRQQFDPQKTRDTLFTTRSGEKNPVQLMHLETALPLHVTTQYTAVDLPYGRGAYAMTVIVPATGVTLEDVIQAMSNGEWTTLNQALTSNTAPTTVDVDLPKFTLNWSDSLNAPLTTLGMGIAFSDAANFSNLFSDNTPLQISSVFQKTFVDVDEEGTTAAAATGVGVIATAVEIPPVVRADHPFLYVLRERLSGTILFVGAFTHPPAQ